MRHRALPSGVRLTTDDAAVIKGMLARGDRQHDVAAWFGVNGGRIGEIATGRRFRSINPATEGLPPPGPYPQARRAVAAIDALAAAKLALAVAERLLGA